MSNFAHWMVTVFDGLTHALRIRADLEQSELTALASISVGALKPIPWERRDPARQKTWIM
ncbi:MAG: hypothetical protein WCI81_09090 [Chlorobiaceae bacterium]